MLPWLKQELLWTLSMYTSKSQTTLCPSPFPSPFPQTPFTERAIACTTLSSLPMVNLSLSLTMLVSLSHTALSSLFLEQLPERPTTTNHLDHRLGGGGGGDGHLWSWYSQDQGVRTSWHSWGTVTRGTPAPSALLHSKLYWKLWTNSSLCFH